MESICTKTNTTSFEGLKIKQPVNASKTALTRFLKEETDKVKKYNAALGGDLKTPQELLGEVKSRQKNNPYNVVLYSGTSQLGYNESAKIAVEAPDGKIIKSSDLNSFITNIAPEGEKAKFVSLFNKTVKTYESIASKLSSQFNK